ncbi:MAG TPA: nitroreductase family protein [Candidatus Anoxymicrobiaceae bacterium]
MIEIDKEKCTSCGKCVEVCPSGIIASERRDGKRIVSVAYPDWCNLCGHCLAVCEPHAVSCRRIAYDDVQELGEIDISPEEMKKLLLARRSVRKYTKEPVADEAIAELIEVAVHAGTGGNLQSVGFIVIRDRDLLDRLELATLDVLWNSGVKFLGKSWLLPLLRMKLGREATDQLQRYYDMMKIKRDADALAGSVFRNAPAAIFAYEKKANRMGALNCAIAMRNVEVMAMTMGLGSCWAGFLISAANLKASKINGMLELGDDERIHGALMLGHPKYAYNVKMPRKARALTYL